MAKYHVGYGGKDIYAGTLNKKGDMLKNKSIVTDEALSSVFDYLFLNDLEYQATINGVRFAMRIELELETETQESEDRDANRK